MGHNGAGCEEKAVETRKVRTNRQELCGERSLCASSASQHHKRKATQLTEQIKRGQARVHSQFLLCYPRYHGEGWKRAACVLFCGLYCSIAEVTLWEQNKSAGNLFSGSWLCPGSSKPASTSKFTQMGKDCKVEVGFVSVYGKKYPETKLKKLSTPLAAAGVSFLLCCQWG